VAVELDPPDPTFVLDVCESDHGIRVLELNPFSGADLYSCDGAAVVRAVEALVSQRPRRWVSRGRSCRSSAGRVERTEIRPSSRR